MIRNFIPFSKIFIGLISVFASCNEIESNDLYGEWIGEYSASDIYIKLDKNQDFYMTLTDENSGQIETISGKFRLDMTKRPIPITIYNISELNHPLHAILEFVDKDCFNLSIFANRERLRPISFNAESTITLRRK